MNQSAERSVHDHEASASSASWPPGEPPGLKAALRKEIADRIHLVILNESEISGKTRDLPNDVRRYLNACLNESEAGKRISLPRPSKKEEVFLILLHQWISGAGPMTSRWIEDNADCTYRTVSLTLEQLGPAVQRYSDRCIELKYFPVEAWKRFLALAHRVRATMHFADSSDQPRSSESLLRRLERLRRSDVAVGGVFGAKKYYPNLDIVGTPRLDLCVHAPGQSVDLSFVRDLDPALESIKDVHRPVRLALHFIRRKNPLFAENTAGHHWADPVECLFHLCEGRLEKQASEFMEHLVDSGKKQSGRND